MKLFPRLPLSTARALAEERSASSWQSLERLASLQHERMFWAPTGNRATDADLRQLRRRIVDVMSEAMPRGTLQGNRYFDTRAARTIRAEMSMSMAEASSAGVWSFVGCVMFPDVVRWRFPGQLGDPTSPGRMLGTGRGVRNALGRLWWRAEVLTGMKPQAIRPPSRGAVGRRDGPDHGAADDRRAAAIGHGHRTGNRRDEIGQERQAVTRNASKRIRRFLAYTDLRALPDEAVQAFVDDCVADAVRAVTSGGLAGTRASESPVEYREVLLRKALSRNDLGETGSHQSAVVISHVDAPRIAPLDESVENPEASFAVRHGSTDDLSMWELIHYNGRLMGHSTRDEFRPHGHEQLPTCSCGNPRGRTHPASRPSRLPGRRDRAIGARVGAKGRRSQVQRTALRRRDAVRS